MRRIPVDHAHAKNRGKCGGDAEILQLNEEIITSENEKSVRLIELDQALDRLAEYDEQQTRIVELRYFSGLTLR